MKTLKNKLDLMVLRAQAELRALRDEENGMEVIQVLILLALGLGLVALFMGFSDTITDRVGELVDDFMSGF